MDLLGEAAGAAALLPAVDGGTARRRLRCALMRRENGI